MSKKKRKGDDELSIELYNKGCIHLREGKIDEGVSLLKQALAGTSNMGGAHLALGGAYQERGMNKEAIQEYTKALHLPASWSALRMTLQAHKRRKERRESHQGSRILRLPH